MIDPSLKQKIIHSTKHLWNEGNLLEAGMVLFERIPLSFRPLWGADILTFACQRISNVVQIQDVIEFARTPEEWADNTDSIDKRKKAHNFFDSVRLLTLEEEQKDTNNKLYGNLLLLAENVAKVTFNAYGYEAPFDHNAGWWIVANLKRITDLVKDADFSAAAWKVLTNERYIELETPIRCNPQCSTCLWLQTFEIK
jgi:hypothetical protein